MSDGSLLVVSMTKRQVLRRSLEGKIAVHADLSHIAGGPCNDMVVDSKGRAYVGNFGYDLYADKRSAQAIIADHPTAKLACVTPDGSAQVAAEDTDFPEGTGENGRKRSAYTFLAALVASAVPAAAQTGKWKASREVDEGIWIVSFMRYDLGFIDLEQKTLQPIDNPFGPRLSPMS